MYRRQFIWVAFGLLVMAETLGPVFAMTVVCVVNEGSSSGCDVTVPRMDEMLWRNITDDSTIRLAQGMHNIASFYLIESLSNLSIVGVGPNETSLTCSESVGLAIVNVTNLRISNLAITGCGLRGANLENTSQAIERHVQLSPVYTLLVPTSRAVVLAACSGAILENVVIEDTMGVGLTGINVIGDSYLNNVIFNNNTMGYSLTERHTSNMVVGGAQFYYGNRADRPMDNDKDANRTDYVGELNNTLHISDCVFSNASSSAFVTQHILVDEFFEIDDFARLHNGTYSLDGAAGLSLIFMRTEKVMQEVVIWNTALTSNTHTHGGCMLILFRNTASTVKVTLEGVLFENCHGGSTGGGLLVGFGYPDSLFPNNAFPLGYIYSQDVYIRNTIFRSCQGTWGGGTAVLSIPLLSPQTNRGRSITFTNCSWEDNLGTTGSAVAFWEAKYHGVQKSSGLNVTMSDCNFSRHSIENELKSQANAAVVNLDAVSVVFAGHVHFFDNQMSCVGATRSEIQVFGQFVAEGSQVIFGGVFDFRDTSFLIVKPRAHLRFTRNEALWRGGAVSVNSFAPWPLSEHSSCFLHFNAFHACPHLPCYNLTNELDKGRIEFEKNSAALFGNEIFGTTFKACPWLPSDISGPELLQYLQEEFNETIVFHTNLSNSTDTVNSNMADVFFTDPNKQVPPTLMPGQLFRSIVRVVDDFNQTVPEVTTLRVTMGDNRVDTSGNFRFDGNIVELIEGEEDVRFVFSGEAGDNVMFQFLPTSVFAPVGSYNFTFTECRPGFIYDRATKRCLCNPVLTELHESITCLPNGTISHGTQRWVGYFSDSNRNLTEGHFVSSLCVFDYCDEEHRLLLDLTDNSKQCSGNRQGLLCGECKEGYSRVVGSSACKRCNNSTLAYILLYVGSGILIVLFIVVFQISICDGYLNGPIVYANLVTTFSFVLFPQQYPRFKSVPYILISFLNLTLGYETCFYDGLTELQLQTWSIVFPLYLLLITAGFSLMVRLCPNRSYQLKLYPISAIATIIFISFNSLLQSCSEILGVAVLTFRGSGADDHSEVRWLRDPTVRYGHGLHGFLVALSLFLLIFVLTPFVALLIFYNPLKKVKAFNKRLQKWWPFFDAFHNPYVNHLRFWIGIQFILRAASLFIAESEQLPNSSNISLRQFSLFIMVLALATFICIEALLKPFKGILRNVLELVFLLNLLYILTSALYYNIVRISTEVDEGDRQNIQELHYITVQTCLSSAVALIVLIFLFFVLVRFGLLEAIDTRVLPNLSPRLQKLAIAVLEDAGHTPSVAPSPNKSRTESSKRATTTTVELNMLDTTPDDVEMTMSSNGYCLYRDSILDDVSRSMEEEQETNV